MTQKKIKLKTINNQQLVGDGNITIESGSNVDIVTNTNGWNSTTSDSKIPSEKLVKNSLDNKLDKTHSSYKGKNVVTNSSTGAIEFEDKPTIPSASSTTPSADTENGSYGSGTSYARANHTHPKSSLYAESSHTHNNYLTSSDISGKIDTAGTGLSKSGTTLNHSNSVTALTTASLKKVKYDAQGHITGTSDVTSSDLPSHTHSPTEIGSGISDSEWLISNMFNDGSTQSDFNRSVNQEVDDLWNSFDGYAPLSHNHNGIIDGGVNLCVGEPSSAGSDGYVFGVDSSTFHNKKVYYKDDSSNSSSTFHQLSWNILPEQFTYEDVFTFSFYAKGTGQINARFYGDTSSYIKNRRIASNSTVTGEDGVGTLGDGNTVFAINSSWKKYYVTWQLASSGNDPTLTKYVQLKLYGGNTVYVSNVQLERGYNATDYNEQYLTSSALNGYQTTSNLVTSFSSTTSDSKYPSEKLTKDSLDLKSDATHTHGNINNDGTITGSASSSTFTTFAGISNNAIYKANKFNANNVIDTTAHSNLGTSANASQSTINSAIDTLIGSAITYINQ